MVLPRSRDGWEEKEGMSVKIAMKTAHKKTLANTLRAIADIIEESTNKTVTLELDLNFDVEEKASK